MIQAIKTAFLLGLLDSLFLIVGFLVGHGTGLIIAALLAVVVNGISYWTSDRVAVAAAHAQPITEAQAPEIYAIVRDLTQETGMPMPRIYVANDPSPNAFATGRNPKHAAVCVTTGILQLCDARELKGVLGHELSHVRNRDILTASIAATLAMGIAVLAQMAQFALMFGGFGGNSRDENGDAAGMLIVALLAAPAAAMIQLAISRSREYEADRDGARLAHDPLALRDALYKLEMQTRRVPMQVAPAFAPLYIVNPFGGKRHSLANLFSTHPPLEDRIRRLERMAQTTH